MSFSEPWNVFHKGELMVQTLAHVPLSSTDWIVGDMSRQIQKFLEDLPYLFFGFLDKRGQPWCSVLTGPEGFIKVLNERTILIDTTVPADDPIVEQFTDPAFDQQLRLFGGVGVMLHNRRRNKIAGRIDKITSIIHLNNRIRITFQATVSQAYGNCPKYITVRDIKYCNRMERPELVSHSQSNSDDSYVQLSDIAISLISRSDAVYLSTSRFHDVSEDMRDMDVNHRGGPTGFVRVSQDKCSVVIPDYSGNRFFQTLGNIQLEGTAGATWIDYESGDALFMTGKAKNYFDDDAKRIFPPFSRITIISITSFRFISHALNIKSLSDPIFSPYNPPLRLLPYEGSKYQPSFARVELAIVEYADLSPDITKYTISLSEPVLYRPGQYAIIDFSESISVGYRHMSDDDPKLINDDLIRSWTITSFPNFDEDTGEVLPSTSFTVSIKTKPGGLISNILNNMKTNPNPSKSLSALKKLHLNGVAGEFTCWDQLNIRSLVNCKVAFIASGVGITPFLAIWEGIKATWSNRSNPIDIVLIYSARKGDIEVLNQLNTNILKDGDRFSFSLFQTDSPEGRRIQSGDIRDIDDLYERHIYLCGSVSFMDTISSSLEECHVKSEKVHKESFAF